jgi:anti-sigma regulatory factor (Ser/Thr protein kinase)
VHSNQGPVHSDLALTARPDAARQARLHVARILREWNLAGLADTAELLVSELVTNAVRATAELLAVAPAEGPAPADPSGRLGTIRLRLSRRGERLRIEVWDADDRPPEPRTADAEAEGGRGLPLVAALSADWGWRPVQDGGKVVWCEPAGS